MYSYLVLGSVLVAAVLALCLHGLGSLPKFAVSHSTTRRHHWCVQHYQPVCQLQREYWQIKVTKILLSNCRHLNEVVYISVSQLWWPETIHCTPLCAASKPIRLKYDVTIFLQDSLHTVKNVGSLLNMHPEGKLYEVAELLQ